MDEPVTASQRPRPRSQRPRVRLWHLGLGGVLIGLVVLVATVWPLSAVISSQERLLVVGEPVEAIVIEAPGPHGFDPPSETYRLYGSIQVSYEFGGRSHRARLTLNDDSPALQPGDYLTVHVDPEAEDHVAAENFDNQPAWVVNLEVLGFVVGPVLILVGVGCLVAALRAVRQARRRPAA